MSASEAPIRLQLQMTAFYKDPIWSSDAACAEFLSLVDSSSIFTVAGDVLRTLRPRKNWETDLGVTVGSVAATKGGQYYVGKRDMADGLAQLNELRSAQRLGDYSRHHWGDPVSVNVGVDLSHEYKGAPTRPTAHATVDFRTAEAVEWAGAFSDAMFELFVAMLGVSAPLTARASWWGKASLNYQYEWLSGMAASHERGQAIVPGTRAMLHLAPAAVQLLGGSEAVCSAAPVVEVREVQRENGEAGIAVLLCREPEELTEDRLRAWRTSLLPVLDLPSEDRIPVDWTPRPAAEWLVESDRPLDILNSDFTLLPSQVGRNASS